MFFPNAANEGLVPPEQTIIAVTALFAGLLLVGVVLAGRRGVGDRLEGDGLERARHAVAPANGPRHGVLGEANGAESTLRVVWWLTITIVLLGVGISGSFTADQAPIFLLGGAAVLTVIALHETLGSSRRGRIARVAEVLAAVALIGVLLALTGFASSPFAMLFALVSVTAALAYGPRSGLAAAGVATAAFGVVLLVDPRLGSYGSDDALRLSIGLGATWLLAFIAVAYAGHQGRAMAHAIEQARTDPLTSLFNRAQLFVTLEQEVSRTRRSDRGFCVLMIDLDGLKAINDTTGHLRGDEVLRSLGSVIRTSIRTVDSAYRYGGDEFVVLLPETDIVGAFVVAEKIRGGAEEVGMSMAGPEPVTSVSIGLVSHPEDGLSAEELLAAADRAMYQAKRLGKNQISGNPRPRPALLARRSTTDAPETQSAAQPPPVIADRRTGKRRSTPDLAAAPREDRAVAVELGPIIVSEPETGSRHDEVDDADPQEVRRRIASASRSFDPDHQIRRAMDAFLSPVP
ncbi:MAG: GGDEF domain-containing protein, partial [Chloroflexi bacterium]|nr:GGDEF domain-containing protein [Chloroflexota bacterium]